MPKVDVTTEIEIARPRAEVAAFAADPENVPDWYTNVISIDWQADPPVRVGSQIAVVASFLGRELAYTYEIIEFVEYEKMVMKTVAGPFPMETSYSWESLSDSLTRMTLRNCGEPSGFPSMMAPFVTKMLQQSNKEDLELLKEILEDYQ